MISERCYECEGELTVTCLKCNSPTTTTPHMSEVKVKQLEWGELNEGKTFRALLPIIGSIRVEPYGVCGWWEVLWSMPGQCDKLVPDVFDTPEEAKAAAQADYEKRILSALEPSSAREQALEEAAKWLDDWSEETWGQDVSPEYAATAIRELKSQQNTETSAIEKKKFYHNEWPHDALMAARRDGFIDHNGGEAWRYQFTHKDEKGKYDLLYRDTSNSSIQAALPRAQTGGGE